MSEPQYIPDPDELEDDAAGEQDELYEHYSITADRGQSPLRLDKFLTIHMGAARATASRRLPTQAISWSTANLRSRATRSNPAIAFRW